MRGIVCISTQPPNVNRFWRYWKRWSLRFHFYLLGLRVNPPIRQALAANAFQRFVSALCVVYAQRYAIVVSKIEFCGVTLKMMRAAMLIGAIHTALEYAEKAFNRVRSYIAASVPYEVAHLQIQTNSDQQVRLYNLAMSLWR